MQSVTQNYKLSILSELRSGGHSYIHPTDYMKILYSELRKTHPSLDWTQRDLVWIGPSSFRLGCSPDVIEISSKVASVCFEIRSSAAYMLKKIKGYNFVDRKINESCIKEAMLYFTENAIQSFCNEDREVLENEVLAKAGQIPDFAGKEMTLFDTEIKSEKNPYIVTVAIWEKGKISLLQDIDVSDNVKACRYLDLFRGDCLMLKECQGLNSYIREIDF